jgi:hypothetical protein
MERFLHRKNHLSFRIPAFRAGMRNLKLNDRSQFLRFLVLIIKHRDWERKESVSARAENNLSFRDPHRGARNLAAAGGEEKTVTTKSTKTQSKI